MNYSFTCPLDGCGEKMTTIAATQEEAADNLTRIAQDHLSTTHPEIHKTEEEVRSDITSMMVPESEESKVNP